MLGWIRKKFSLVPLDVMSGSFERVLRLLKGSSAWQTSDGRVGGEIPPCIQHVDTLWGGFVFPHPHVILLLKNGQIKSDHSLGG